MFESGRNGYLPRSVLIFCKGVLLIDADEGCFPDCGEKCILNEPNRYH